MRPDIRKPILSLTAIFSPKISSLSVESNATNSLNKTGKKKDRTLTIAPDLPAIAMNEKTY